MNTLFDELKSFAETGFREIYHRFIYIHCRELLDDIFPGELDTAITGFIAYCYIDRTEGISFRPFMIASMKEDGIQVFTIPNHEDTIYILRLRDGQTKMSELHDGGNHMYLYALDPDRFCFFDLSVVNFDTDSFHEIKDDIDRTYSAGEMVEEFRSEKYKFLDKYRHRMYPDDVQAFIFNEKNHGVEQVWVRLSFMTEKDEIFGELLNEPYKDYGCHEGDFIEINEVTAGDETILIFTGRTAQIRNS